MQATILKAGVVNKNYNCYTKEALEKTGILHIPIHSVVDLITNSSSTIFTYSDMHHVGKAKELMQTIMAAMGITGDPEDYFEFGLTLTDEGEERLRMDWEDGELDGLDESSTEEEFQAYIKCLPVYPSNEYGQPYTDLVIKAKNGDGQNLAYKMFWLFDQEVEWS